MVMYRVTRRRGPHRRQFTVPTWAERIEVQEQDCELIVTGYGMSFTPTPGLNLDDWDNDFLAGFDVARRLTRDQIRFVPHLLFASANTRSKQIEFVRRFGPVLATKVAFGPDDNALAQPSIVAQQDLELLDLEQRLFVKLLELVRSLATLDGLSKGICKLLPEFDSQNPPVTLTDHPHLGPVQLADLDAFIMRRQRRPRVIRQQLDRAREILTGIRKIGSMYHKNLRFKMGKHLVDVPRPFDWHRDVGFDWFASREDDCIPTVLMRAHMLLCRVFNHFPLDLYFENGVVQQLPSSGPLGVRPLLYYMLRTEYLEPREIRICAHPNCGLYFVPDRSNTLYCRKSCANSHKLRRFRAKAKAGVEQVRAEKVNRNKGSIDTRG